MEDILDAASDDSGDEAMDEHELASWDENGSALPIADADALAPLASGPASVRSSLGLEM